MADIDVVPKYRSYSWLWIALAIIVVALLFWALAGRTHAAATMNGLPETLAFAASLRDNLLGAA
jgi:hypothetical protein